MGKICPQIRAVYNVKISRKSVMGVDPEGGHQPVYIFRNRSVASGIYYTLRCVEVVNQSESLRNDRISQKNTLGTLAPNSNA